MLRPIRALLTTGTCRVGMNRAGDRERRARVRIAGHRIDRLGFRGGLRLQRHGRTADLAVGTDTPCRINIISVDTAAGPDICYGISCAINRKSA